MTDAGIEDQKLWNPGVRSCILILAATSEIERKTMTLKTETGLHTAETYTAGGRDGASRSSDGRLDVKLSSPEPAHLNVKPLSITD